MPVLDERLALRRYLDLVTGSYGAYGCWAATRSRAITASPVGCSRSPSRTVSSFAAPGGRAMSAGSARSADPGWCRSVDPARSVADWIGTGSGRGGPRFLTAYKAAHAIDSRSTSRDCVASECSRATTAACLISLSVTHKPGEGARSTSAGGPPWHVRKGARMSHPQATTHNIHWSGSGMTLWGELRLDERDCQSQRGVTYRMRNSYRIGLKTARMDVTWPIDCLTRPRSDVNAEDNQGNS
eukprot:538683-Rhodomonas_salina.3